MDLVFPPTCVICGKIEPKWICNKCSYLLRKETEAECGCVEFVDCQENFSELLYLFSYKGVIRDLILKFKFQSCPYISKIFVNFLLKNEKIFQKIKKYDTIIPVPISKERKLERGYNQSLVFARELCKYLENVEIVDNCLYKTKNTVPQSTLSKQEREENIKNAYELKNKQIIRNKKILLIDDIYTTGNTVNECAKILKDGNPKNIGVLTIAKD